MQNSLTASPRIAADEMSESDAIRLAGGGDARAFEHIYKLHSARVYRLCLRLAGNPADAEDFTQEAFLQLFRKIHTFRGESNFFTWLHRLTVNVVLMRRRKKRHPEVSLDAPVEPGQEDSKPLEFGAPDLRLSGMLDHVNLSRAIEQLPDGYREMFVLHDVEGYEHREISKVLGCSIGNSKSQLFKARVRLRELLRDPGRTLARDQRKSQPTIDERESPATRDERRSQPARGERVSQLSRDERGLQRPRGARGGQQSLRVAARAAR
jgi:RNA polymerase sigma-70 factor (ECF subfamily)